MKSHHVNWFPTVSWAYQDDTLQFLSQEEQECIQFFEETIDSLEESLEENDRRPRQVQSPVRRSRPLDTVDGPATSSVSSLLARPPSPKDQDIIDLVRPKPDLVQTKEPIFIPTSPGNSFLLVCRVVSRILEVYESKKYRILYLLMSSTVYVGTEACSLSKMFTLQFVPSRFSEYDADP